MVTLAAADGSCIGNPGPGGWGWVTAEGRQGRGASRRTTNNVMELRAVLELLRATDPREPLVIQTDSAYVVGVFTQWLARWKLNGMRTAAKKPVENAALIAKIADALKDRDVTFEKVPGHAGHALNELADALAQTAARYAASWVAQNRQH
jgi:ribonuclease HI